jgi:hypothetical protein
MPTIPPPAAGHISSGSLSFSEGRRAVITVSAFYPLTGFSS